MELCHFLHLCGNFMTVKAKLRTGVNRYDTEFKKTALKSVPTFMIQQTTLKHTNPSLLICRHDATNFRKAVKGIVTRKNLKRRLLREKVLRVNVASPEGRRSYGARFCMIRTVAVLVEGLEGSG